MFKSPFIERIIILFALIAIFFTVHQCRSVKQEKGLLLENLKVSKDSIRTYRLSNGSLVAEKESYRVSMEDYKKDILITKTAQNELKRRIGNLNSLNNDLRLSLTARGDIQVPVTDTLVIIKHDTVKAEGLYFRDSFLTLNGLRLNDSLRIDYHFRTGLDIATYWKTDGIFKPRSLVVNVKPDNPHVTITGLDNYAIVEKKKFYQTKGFWFGVGFIAAAILKK